MNVDIVDVNANVTDITLEKIVEASKNITKSVEDTPIVTIDEFNTLFGHDLFFKLENLQKTGSFKIRGVINILHKLKNNNKLPKKIVTYSSGNHGIALAWASKLFGIKEIKIYLPHSTAEIKKELVKNYGAQIIMTKTRAEAEKRAQMDAELHEYLFIPSSDDNDVICGAATASYEALQKQSFDAIFVPIGGGGLASGTFLVKNYISPTTKVYAGEPKKANDASISYKTRKLFRFEKDLHTIADGAVTLGITKRIFNYVKHLDGIHEIAEEEIKYWTAQFYKYSKNFCEPTSALALASAYHWTKAQANKNRKKLLIIITGGNISSAVQKNIIHSKYLNMALDELKIHK